ncbi:MAG: shikimate dehydrogenase [Nitrospiraceae bacterium]|nr:shikimate dehydrogenase [Nitrospiraceae bacterium]
MISGKTSLYGIFGHPVEHTFSPGMHNAAFASLNMDARYVAFSVKPELLAQAVKAIVPLGLRGLNVTVPHKERVIAHLDELADDARMIGAVNTIEVRQGKLIGHNTDGRGFLRSLRDEAGVRPQGKTFLLVGAGGAARAVAFTLALNGASAILLHDMDAKKARKLARDVETKTGARSSAIDAGDLGLAAAGANCIINATPLGLRPTDPMPFDAGMIKRSHLIGDLVYNPPLTGLLKAARARGARILPGIGMLLFQGVIAFEIWTGKKAPVAVMKKALVQQMGRLKK